MIHAGTGVFLSPTRIHEQFSKVSTSKVPQFIGILTHPQRSFTCVPQVPRRLNLTAQGTDLPPRPLRSITRLRSRFPEPPASTPEKTAISRWCRLPGIHARQHRGVPRVTPRRLRPGESEFIPINRQKSRAQLDR